jgi:hypothetical protein
MQPAWEETAARLAGEVVYVPYPAIRYPTVEYHAMALERVGGITTAIPHPYPAHRPTPHTYCAVFHHVHVQYTSYHQIPYMLR